MLQDIVGVFEKSGEKVINKEDVVYSLIREYSYGVNFEVRVGIYYNDKKGEIDKDYIIYFANNAKSELVLHSKIQESVGKDNLLVLIFVNKTYSKMLKNKLPNNFSYLNISFKKYIKERNNQLEYFAFELRKKGLLVENDNNGVPKAIHIQKKIHEKAKDTEAFIVKPIIGYELKAPNYYTRINGQVVRTKNGQSDPIFLPNATKEEINGLDNYLIPKYELWGTITMYNLGDTVSINNKNYIIIEKESFYYRGKRKVYMICAEKV